MRHGLGSNGATRDRMRLTALLVALAAAAAIASGEDRPPVELRNPPPQMPLQVVGAGIEPEVTVELVIDERGRVESVEVLKIVPSTRWDDLVAEAMISTLETWRYAPRYQGGRAVATRLQWTMQFSNVDDGELGGWSDRSWWEALLPLGLGRNTSGLLTLPAEQRLELLSKDVSNGVRLLGGSSSTVHQSPRFTVRTDSTPENAAAIATNLEAAYNALDAMIAPVVPPQPETHKMQVLVFEERGPFVAYHTSSRPYESVGDGFYSQLGVISFHLQLAAPREALEMILHEATHAYVDRHVLRPGVVLPHWLAEGLAEYLGNSKVEKGTLQPGSEPRRLKQYLWFREGRLQMIRDKSGAATALDEIKRAARRGETLALAEMLDADRDAFYGERLRLYYGMSWLLVHFLRHGRSEWAEGAFPELLLYAGEGFPISASLAQAYGVEPAELEPEFRAYLAAF